MSWPNMSKLMAKLRDRLGRAPQPVLANGQYSNPVIDSDMPDPFILKVRGLHAPQCPHACCVKGVLAQYRDHWLAYGTNAAGGNVQVGRPFRCSSCHTLCAAPEHAAAAQIARSADLVHWERLPDALPRLPVWARPGLTWAPCCCCIPLPGFRDQFVLFFVARENATDRQAIGVAVCDRPEGPFDSKDERPLISTVRLAALLLRCTLLVTHLLHVQPAEGGSIDPSCCLDANGRCILFWVGGCFVLLYLAPQASDS